MPGNVPSTPTTAMAPTCTSLALVILSSIAVAGSARAQTPDAPPGRPSPRGAQQQHEPTQAELVARRDEKRALPVFEKADWTFDYDAALARARKEDKPVFVYFTRSYSH